MILLNFHYSHCVRWSYPVCLTLCTRGGWLTHCTELNGILDELYAKHAIIFDAEEWFDQNPFCDAAADMDVEQWESHR